MKRLVLTTCLCLSIFSTLFSQTTNTPLNEVNESVITDSQNELERVITPNNYKTLQLDADELVLILNSAPQEAAAGTDHSERFEVPLPNGETEVFHLVEYTMMEPGLAAKFPTFKTYYGYGVNDRNHRIRLDWTSNGLNAMLSLPEGLAFIKPYSRGNTDYYLSYYELDLPVDTEPFNCGTLHDKFSEPAPLENAFRAGDCQLRTYRLAIAVTGEYATSTLGTSAAGDADDEADVTAHIVSSVNQINEWYERDITARFILIDDLPDIFYYNGSTDPYTNSSSTAMLGENISNLSTVIGNANFDLGHVLGQAGGSGGVAGLNVLCGSSKARGVTRASASGITQPRFLKVWAHEMGHQFGAGHTQGEDCNRSSTSAMEPGAGSTIMSYVTSACSNQIQGIPDFYFHAISIQQMSARMLNTTCATILDSDNAAPTVAAGPNVAVPSSTPLRLEATASDPDTDDLLTYTWEQFDNEVAEAIPPASTNTQGPSFRSLLPSTESTRYLPNLAAVIDGTTPTWEVLPSVARTMEFRVTVRDNSTNSISCTDEDNIVITTVASGPFLVTSPTTSGVIWVEGTNQTVTWDVAGTDVAPVSCANVDILLSYDGGLTYPTTLATSVANNGSANITVPTGITTTARVQVRCSDNIFYNISASNFEIEISTGPTFLLNLPNSVSTICAGDVESNISISTSALSGFTGDVTFSASNLPGSAAVTFTNQTIAAGSGTTFEISNTAGLAAGSYIFTLTGTSGSIVRNLNYILTVDEPAGITTLDLPVDNAVDVGLIPILSWMLNSNTTSYDIQVSEESTFATLIVDEISTTNSFTLDSSLEGMTLYYWRVKASTNCGDTPWSVSREFTTEDCAVAYIENTPVTIPSSGTPEVNSVLSITGPGVVEDLEISDIIGTHSWVADLEISLIAPGGTPIVLLWDGECGSSDDFHLSFSDTATDPVADAPCSPLGQGGTFIPEESLSAFNGLPIAGDWTLRINDNANQDGGVLNSWRLDFCSASALPVELLSFNATGRKDDIHLEWKTAAEINNANFEIERRTEFNTEFTSIGKVLATDDIQQVNHYEYIDEDVIPGIQYYYRLRQNDLDGQFEHSQIRTASIEDGKPGLQVYPSPVRGELFGSLNVRAGLETELQLHDLNGRVVKSQITSGNHFVMDLTGFPAGLYMLKARHAEGEEIIKLVVK